MISAAVCWNDMPPPSELHAMADTTVATVSTRNKASPNQVIAIVVALAGKVVTAEQSGQRT